jgi:hypothetical protein
MKTKILLSFITLIAFMLMMIGCEAENPGEPKANIMPETYISEASPGNTTTISYYGTDRDGFVDIFAYKWAADNDWTQTESNTVSFDNAFANQTEVKTFYVKGIDDLGGEDPTPAEIVLTASNVLPTTVITGGPEFDKESGEDATFTFSGEDIEAGGSISSFEYTMDDLNNWHSTDVDHAEATFLGLSEGAHTFYVRAIDNLDGADPSPAQVAFYVRVGTYTPTLVNQSAVSDGGGWFAGAPLTFAWSAITATYYGTLAEAPFSFAYDDSTNFDTNPVTYMESGWTATSSYAVTPEAGDHTMYIKVRDTAGGVSLMRIRFNAADAAFDQGILVVNGISHAYGSELTDMIDASAYWNTYTVDFWDLFGYDTYTDLALPASVANYVGGGGPTPADVMGRYSTVVWLGNNYSGDIDHWFLSPILQYLNAGGNLILASRLAADFFDDDLDHYLNIGWREGAGTGDSGDGISLSEYKACFPGLVDMTPDGSSLANCVSGGGFMSSSADQDLITNWDGTTGFTKSTLIHTMIFAHRSDAYDPTFAPVTYVRALGVWAHPNFEFSSQTAGNEFPSTDDEKKGNFILLNGREYRNDITSTTHNYTFMLQNMCGE